MKVGQKVVWVTGGTRGLGLHLVRMFAAMDFAVVTNYSGDEAAAIRLRNEAIELGWNVYCQKTSCADEAGIRMLCDWISEKYGHLDILINNAGIGMHGTIEDVDGDAFRSVLETNLLGKYICIRSARFLLERSSYASIINIASAGGVQGSAKMMAYNSAAAGIILMSQMLARELADRSIRVNCVSPSMFEGGMADRFFSREDRDAAAKMNPMGRLGCVDDIAECIRWLCSEEASYINGENIMMTGGR